MSPQPRKPAAASKAAAARAEKTGEQRTVDFRGLTLKLPATLPGSLYFDVAELEHNDGPATVLRILGSLVGDEQMGKVRSKIVEDGVSFGDVQIVLMELFNDVLDAHGLSVGESPASAES